MTQLDRLPTHAEFAHVTDWVFDLDNTLYPHQRQSVLADRPQHDGLTSPTLAVGWTRRTAKKLQKEYYRDHGTTLQGLMIHHGIDPNDFLEKAHAIDYSVVPAGSGAGRRDSRRCRGASSSSPTAASQHAEMTARALGILDHFNDIFDIVAADFVPKPAGDTYDKFMSLHRVDTTQCGHVRGPAAQPSWCRRRSA